MIRLVAALCLILGLSACGNLIPVPGAVSNLYNLSPKSTFRQDLPAVEWQLVIDEPLASGGLNSASIAFKPSPLEVRYFKDVRWTERVPRMVQTLLVESFENSGTIVAVGRQAIGLRADFALKTEIREFQAERAAGHSIRVRVNAKLIQQPRQNIVASRSFDVSVKESGDSMRNTIIVWDEAMGRVLRQIVEWTIIEGETAYRARRR